MGSICPTVSANTVVLIEESALRNAVSEKRNTKPLDVVMKQVIRSATYYPRQSNDREIHEEHTNLSFIPLENSKLSLFNESKKHRYLAGVSSQVDSMQPLEQISTHRKSKQYRSQTADTRAWNRLPTLPNDHHCKTSNERKSSISGKSIIAKYNQIVPNTINRPIEKDTDDSTKETTVLSKTIIGK